MSQAKEEVKPPCRYATTLKEGNTWVKEELTEMLRTWYDPCSECYPDEVIDTDEIIKKDKRNSRRQHLHRPQE